MLYKMIYFSSYKFAFSNLRFSQFYEHFRQLREKYAFKLKIKYIMLISSLSPIWWCIYIWLFLKKPLHWTIQNILLTPNPFHCFFAKSLWAGKKYSLKMKRYKQILLYVVSTMSSIYNWCDRWHVKCIIKKLIVSVQNFWYAPCRFKKNIFLIKIICHHYVNFNSMSISL